MKFIVSTIMLSLLAQTAVLPSRSVAFQGLEHRGIKSQRTANEDSNGIDVTKPVAVATSDALRTLVSVALAEATTLSTAQATAETLGTFVARPKP
ncbi:hypothetical protein DSO57_1021647 [Entomophthora muscae]|uniref:Uncharacterized protein n=1 Tax=Entomophthora muscae TaxID=34485 RepID=A0ACC2TQJ6_9FUNG|nr:hypothetical protein DSO57_1021647 [Entomophthora muscae]